jgi:multidrug efflux pump subunit AcrA (membrane-fusion protein)
MQRERATAQRNIQEIETRISGLYPCQNVPFNEHDACLRRSSAEFARIAPQLAAERGRIQQQQQQARALDEGLARANHAARQEEDRARLANQIIANKDVLARLDRLDGRLDSASGTLESIERAFNRSLLEAYISQKMNKMSANFCEASALCASSPREAPQRLMNRVFDEERIKTDARNPRAPQTRQ